MITAGPSTPLPHSILLALVAPVIPLTALSVGDEGAIMDLLPPPLMPLCRDDDDVRLG